MLLFGEGGYTAKMIDNATMKTPILHGSKSKEEWKKTCKAYGHGIGRMIEVCLLLLFLG